MIGNMSEIVGFVQAVLDYNAPALSNHHGVNRFRGHHVWAHAGRAVRLWFFELDEAIRVQDGDEHLARRSCNFHIEVTTHYGTEDKRVFMQEASIDSLRNMHARNIFARNLKDALLK